MVSEKSQFYKSKLTFPIGLEHLLILGYSIFRIQFKFDRFFTSDFFRLSGLNQRRFLFVLLRIERHFFYFLPEYSLSIWSKLQRKRRSISNVYKNLMNFILLQKILAVVIRLREHVCKFKSQTEWEDFIIARISKLRQYVCKYFYHERIAMKHLLKFVFLSYFRNTSHMNFKHLQDLTWPVLKVVLRNPHSSSIFELWPSKVPNFWKVKKKHKGMVFRGFRTVYNLLKNMKNEALSFEKKQ